MREQVSRDYQQAQSPTGLEGADVLRQDEVSCADEEIRVPGSVQAHGFLLGVDPDQDSVVFASENTAQFLGLPLRLVLGSKLELILEREMMASVRGLRAQLDPEGLVTYLGAFNLHGELFSVMTHCVEGRRILEFERQDRLVGSEMMNSVITNFVGTLSRLQSERELVEAITRQVAELSGFDRVLLYSFDAAGHGTVLTEENSGRLPSYLDLRFPGTDIPVQARALYTANTVRTIPDATYTPVPLRGIAGEAPATLDMSQCVLRSVSPVHLEYMRNMGTIASMSVSIVVEGRLWGLISGHHAEPRVVPFLVRSACDMLTRMMATQLHSFQTASKLRRLVHFHDVQRRMLTQMAAENDYVGAIAQQMPALMQVTDAAGAVLAVDGHFESTGEVPGNDTLRRMVDWLGSHPSLELFETNRLGSEIDWAEDALSIASGLLAIRISDVRPRYVLWFRPEVVRTVKWAGEPVKQVDADRKLHPRSSFNSWKETLRGQSEPWASVEVESAREFRNAVMTISLRRVEEEAELSEARFAKLTQALPIKVFAVTDDGLLTYVNARWRDAGLGEHGLWFEGGRLVPEDAARCASLWPQAVTGETEFEEEVRLLDAGTGVEGWNLVRLVPFRREGAERAGWIGACIDLTERKERETAMRVTEKLTLTGRITSFLAHEINNPLEAITNLLYLLRQDVPADAAASSYFGMVDAELERISGSVKQTLRWSAQNSDGRAWFAIVPVLEDARRLLGAKIRNRDIRAEIEGSQDIRMFGIEGQIRQVVAHLLSNAVDAVNVSGRVRMQVRRLDDEVEITVSDDGVGMSDEQQHSLFKPFYSTKGDLGNGLGLYISKEIAERHHGSFLVESAPGAGTTVTLCMPVQ